MKEELGIKQVELFDAEEVREEIKVELDRGSVNSAPRLKPINRKQLLLRSVDVERLVSEDHEVRAIWEFVGQLDLSRYYKNIKVKEGEAGCCAFDPRLLISIWIYSYGKGISSAREISRLCEYDPAYQWLTGIEVINYHTLSDFRVENKEALDKLFIEVLGLLSVEGLITLERVTHDGTKIKAHASSDTFRREAKVLEHLRMAEEQVKQMNEEQKEETNLRVVKARARAVRERRQKLGLALQELEKIRQIKADAKSKDNARVSETDPEARIMKQAGGGYAPSYNVQISTDDKEKIIVGVRTSQSGTDYGELKESEEIIEKNLGSAPKQMVVDGGFVTRENILAMNAKGVELIGSVGDTSVQSEGQFKRRGVDPAFYPKAFSYDIKTDTYTCPGGKLLRYEGKEQRVGTIKYRYRASANDCKACDFKQKCCPKAYVKGRTIVRGVDDPVVLAFMDRMKTEEAKAIYKLRGAVSEFPNAWIKEKIGLRQFKLRGLIKAGIEALWACLTYNIKQWIRLCWRKQEMQIAYNCTV